MLCRATNVAAAICHVLSPEFTQLGYGTGTAPAASRCTTRVLLSYGSYGQDRPATDRTPPIPPGSPSPRQAARSAAPRMKVGRFGTVTPVLPTCELDRPVAGPYSPGGTGAEGVGGRRRYALRVAGGEPPDGERAGRWGRVGPMIAPQPWDSPVGRSGRPR